MKSMLSGGIGGAAAVVVLLSSLLIADPAEAQRRQNILVINQAELLRDSKAGKAISEQAKEMRTKFRAEIDKEKAAGKKAGEKYKKNRSVMSPEQRKTELEKLRKTAIKIRGLEIQRGRELQIAVSRGQKQIFDALGPILEKMIEERKATMLIDREFLVFVSDDINITAEAMKRLDAKLKTVKLQQVARKAPSKKEKKK